MRGLRLVAGSAPLLAVFALALSAGAAQADVVEHTYNYGPITVAGYQVLQNTAFMGVPKPTEDGFITHMSVDLVNSPTDPTMVPMQRIMLHHIVFANLGTYIGDKHDATCNTITALDSKTKLPALAERFYGAGEERQKMALPDGYGYPTKGADSWLMTWMLMNHRPQADTVYIQYHVTVDTSPTLTPVRPYWLDVRKAEDSAREFAPAPTSA